MKKSIGITAGVIVVLAGGWLGGTWYTGKRIETETQQRLGVLNEKLAAVVPGYTLRVDQLKYERGFFTTQARYGLSLSQDIKEESGTVTPLPLGSTEFDARFEHGPFPRSALASGQFLPQMAFVHAELARTELVKPLFETIPDLQRGPEIMAAWLDLPEVRQRVRLAQGDTQEVML
ncbi:phosphoenolpyruvate carboxylase-like protein, partial [Bordetella bronchiseptica E012]|uniref:phosphoenolpyruvate carboxylase n=1 Tax=Bordetella bronchiseptica TaxID=518 RepID=UPI000461E04E